MALAVAIAVCFAAVAELIALVTVRKGALWAYAVNQWVDDRAVEVAGGWKMG